MYIQDPGRYDKGFNALHPYRKLRGIAHSLYEERRSVCMKLLGMFKFRQVTLHRDDGASGPIAELVGDFYSPDGDRDPSFRILVLLFVSALLIQVAKVLDVPLPFPVVFGTCVSSPCVHSPVSAYETGCPPHPRILHAFKRVILPLYSDAVSSAIFENSTNLLVENLRFIAAVTNQVPISAVPVSMDPVALLGSIFNSTQLGRETFSPLSKSSAPSLTGSPSASHRGSVIEQSVTEGGEWTLLDQL